MTADSPDITRFVDPASRLDPYPLLARFRAASPYVVSDGLLVAGRHADCSAVLRDPRMSSERYRSRLSPGVKGPRTRNFLDLDPPDHTRLRRLVVKAFTPRVVAKLEPRIRELTEGLFQEAARRDRFEIVSELAYPLPLRVICELLGVPFEDRDLFEDWSGKLSETLEPPFPGLVAPRASTDAVRARAEFITYFRELIAERRRSPRDDLVSHLVQAEESGDRLSETETLATCVLLINAGHETTVNLISNGVLALLNHPDQLKLLRENPALAPAAVEEVLRYDAPVQMTSRVARGDGHIGSLPVRDGDTVVLMLGAANRDPEVFDEPDTFDVTRPQGAKHLSFSAGPHFCVGAGLARLEARIAFELFVTRVAAPSLAEDGLMYKPNLTLRGPDRLTVLFDDIQAPS
ncbi:MULTISPECIES: cytochrome P450 [Streptomyces]|uniref:Cytochrome P450 n=1 Tax=Streptomyces parvus TaxID=66428 RepID=A0A5D4ID34_9ACTN|nr:cytochrome P450 [Streptomyces parvus]TYR49573.1 cytochrome P450 [Streptomyces parvus]